MFWEVYNMTAIFGSIHTRVIIPVYENVRLPVPLILLEQGQRIFGVPKGTTGSKQGS